MKGSTSLCLIAPKSMSDGGLERLNADYSNKTQIQAINFIMLSFAVQIVRDLFKAVDARIVS
jgi:hypothetical protein